MPCRGRGPDWGVVSMWGWGLMLQVSFAVPKGKVPLLGATFAVQVSSDALV